MRYIFLIAFLLLAGCTSYVNVPTWVCPPPVIPPAQQLKVPAVPKDALSNEIFKAMVWDYTYLKGRVSQLEIVLEGYKKPPAEMLAK